MVKHLGHPIASIPPTPHRPVDQIARAQIRYWSCPSVPRQDRRVAPAAVSTRMGASAIWIDGPAEGHPGCVRNPVERGPRADLVETGVERLGCVEGAHRGRLAVPGEGPGLLGV